MKDEEKYMEQEKLDIFTENMIHIGTATRAEVHKIGYWHQTFHCWFLEKDTESILFQRRHKSKKDYPSQLDITVAGHLTAGEGPMHGLREIQEEVGISVQEDELTSLGIYQGAIIVGDMIDKEFCHLYFYENNHPLNTFTLQDDEVESIVRIPLKDLIELFSDHVDEITSEEFYIENGEVRKSLIVLSRADFVSHEKQYYSLICNKANDYFNSYHAEKNQC